MLGHEFAPGCLGWSLESINTISKLQMESSVHIPAKPFAYLFVLKMQIHKIPFLRISNSTTRRGFQRIYSFLARSLAVYGVARLDRISLPYRLFCCLLHRSNIHLEKSWREVTTFDARFRELLHIVLKKLFKACVNDLFLIRPCYTLVDEDCLSMVIWNDQLHVVGWEAINPCMQRDVNATRLIILGAFLEPSSPPNPTRL